MTYIANVVDNELDEHPQTVVVCGGDLNKLNIGRLEELTGWSAILDFTTRGLSYLVHCLSNRTNLLGKCWQNLITVVCFYRLAESFVPKFRSTIKESRDSVIYAWHWQRKTGEMFFGPRMLTKQLINSRELFVEIWTCACRSRLLVNACRNGVHVVIVARAGWPH